MKQTESIVVLVTCGSAAEAERLAEALVHEHLAACVNVGGPIRSIYRWENAVQRDPEWIMVIKTHGSRFAELETRIRELHSYDTPEVIALPIVAGSAAYLAWLAQATATP
jgi:periplasmic divalent cation tolerance protein